MLPNKRKTIALASATVGRGTPTDAISCATLLKFGILFKTALSAKIATRHNRPRIANEACNNWGISFPFLSRQQSRRHAALEASGALLASESGTDASTAMCARHAIRTGANGGP